MVGSDKSIGIWSCRYLSNLFPNNFLSALSLSSYSVDTYIAHPLWLYVTKVSIKN